MKTLTVSLIYKLSNFDGYKRCFNCFYEVTRVQYLHFKVKEVAILTLMVFYLCRLFCHNHSCVFAILPVMLWCMDSSLDLKSDNHGLESWQGSERKAVYTEGGGSICKCAG